MLAAWWTSGKIPASETDHWRKLGGILRRLYGDSPAERFGTIALKAFRQVLIDEGLARSTINSAVHKVRRVFRYAVACELIFVAIADALQTVEGLEKG